MAHSWANSSASASVISWRSCKSPARSCNCVEYLPRFFAAIQDSSVWPPAGVGAEGVLDGAGVVAAGVSGGLTFRGVKGDFGALGMILGCTGGGGGASTGTVETRLTLNRGFWTPPPAFLANLGTPLPEFASSMRWNLPNNLLKRAF